MGKRKIGELYNKPVVEGDVNLKGSNEIHVKDVKVGQKDVEPVGYIEIYYSGSSSDEDYERSTMLVYDVAADKIYTNNQAKYNYTLDGISKEVVDGNIVVSIDVSNYNRNYIIYNVFALKDYTLGWYKFTNTVSYPENHTEITFYHNA